MSELEQLKSELSRVRADLDVYQALFLILFREVLGDKGTSERMLMLPKAISELGLEKDDPDFNAAVGRASRLLARSASRK